MRAVNNVNLIGRITRDVEIKKAGEVSVATFSLAVNGVKRKDKDAVTDFIDIKVFGFNADNIGKYCKKGSQIAVSGEIRLETWKDQEGNNKSRCLVYGDSIQFLDNKSETTSTKVDKSQPLDVQPDIAIDNSDDDLPF